MKVITEERLRELWTQYLTHHMLDVDFEEMMLNECQELDTLTVTRLRPMCEAKDGQEILVKFTWGNELVKVEYRTNTVYREDDSVYSIEECDGFIPMPRYEPETTK